MKIAYLTFDFGVPVAGTKGASVHVRQLVAALGELGHEVLVLTPSVGGVVPSYPKVRVCELRLSGNGTELQGAVDGESACRGSRLAKDIRNLLYNAAIQAEATDMLREFAPDFLYERYSLFGTAGIDLAARLDVPHLVEVNAPLVDEHQRARGISLIDTAVAAERLVFRGADHLVVVSGWLRSYCVERGGEPGRVTVMANGADPDRFSPRPANGSLRRAFGCDASFVVGFVGSMKRWHGVGLLIDALGRMDPGVRLLLVGDGPERERLEQQAVGLGVSDRVHWSGAVPHDEVPAYIAAMDVCVAPLAADAAGYFSPVKLFEYMAMAKPTVAASAGQLPEVIEAGETGWLYPPGDAAALARRLAWIQQHPAQSRATGAAARRRVLECHTWRHNAESVVQIAERLLGRREPMVEDQRQPATAARRRVAIAPARVSPN